VVASIRTTPLLTLRYRAEKDAGAALVVVVVDVLVVVAVVLAVDGGVVREAGAVDAGAPVWRIRNQPPPPSATTSAATAAATQGVLERRSRFAPQEEQNRPPGGIGLPQCGQNACPVPWSDPYVLMTPPVAVLRAGASPPPATRPLVRERQSQILIRHRVEAARLSRTAEIATHLR
jgi:hypothetical protein